MKTLYPILAIALLMTACARADWEFLPNIDAALLESDGERLYAADRTGLYISDDDGDTWRPTGMTHRVYCLGIGDDAVYAYTGTEFGMFRSDDCGETWAPKNAGLTRLDKEDRIDGPIYHPYINQILVTESRMVVAVGYHSGTHISRDRGETWHYPYEEWVHVGPHVSTHIAFRSHTMTEFDSYLWASAFVGFPDLYRTPNLGDTWELMPIWGGHRRALTDYGAPGDWLAHDDRLYVGAAYAFGRWDEGELAWDDLSAGLPHEPRISALAVHRGRIFAGLRKKGIWVFDDRYETWFPAGLPEFGVGQLISHQDRLYATASRTFYALDEEQGFYLPHSIGGIFRASIPVVNPYAKAATTWGAIKQ